MKSMNNTTLSLIEKIDIVFFRKMRDRGYETKEIWHFLGRDPGARSLMESIRDLLGSQSKSSIIDAFLRETSCPDEIREIWESWIDWDYWDRGGHTFDYCVETTCSTLLTEKDLQIFELMVLVQSLDTITQN